MENKIIVVGCPGSGKSFFSKELHKKLHIPVFHLDRYYWKANWEHLEIDEFQKIQDEIMDSNPSYIIDGLYFKTFENRFKNCSRMYFLDFDTEDCLKAVKNRCGKKRDDFPEFLDDAIDEEFLLVIKSFSSTVRDKIIKLMKDNPNKEYIVIHNRKEMDDYLSSL